MRNLKYGAINLPTIKFSVAANPKVKHSWNEILKFIFDLKQT